MTSIVYKPHCANCGALIHNDVSCKEVMLEQAAPNGYFCHKMYDISPYRCENCGELFEAIEVKLPECD